LVTSPEVGVATILGFIGLFVLMSVKKDKEITKEPKVAAAVEESIAEPLPRDITQPTEAEAAALETGTTAALSPDAPETIKEEEPPEQAEEPPPVSPPPPKRQPADTGKIQPQISTSAKVLDEALALYRNGSIGLAITKLDRFCSDFEKSEKETCPNRIEIITLNSIKIKYQLGVESLKNKNISQVCKGTIVCNQARKSNLFF